MLKEEILQKFSFFTRSAPAFRSEVLESVRRVTLPSGTFYLQEGDRCASLALVGSGNIRVFKVSESGREITLYHVQPGESCLLNVSCLLTGRPVPASARVEEPVEAVVVTEILFRKWMAESEQMREYVFGLLAERFAAITTLIEEVAFKRMDQRLAAYLVEGFGDGKASERGIVATHERIAADLGTAREVVSRLLKDFERQEAIRLGRGRIDLRSEPILRSFIQSE